MLEKPNKGLYICTVKQIWLYGLSHILILQAEKIKNCAKIIVINMSTYSANFRFVACKLLKLEAPENTTLQTQFACKSLVFVQKCSGIGTYSLNKI